MAGGGIGDDRWNLRNPVDRIGETWFTGDMTTTAKDLTPQQIAALATQAGTHVVRTEAGITGTTLQRQTAAAIRKAAKAAGTTVHINTGDGHLLVTTKAAR